MTVRPASADASGVPPCVIVLHIPKTAGTSLLTIVRRQYGREHTFEFAGPDWAQQIADFASSVPPDIGRIRCLIGHVPFGVHRLLPQATTYITLLREPVDWTLSAYFALLTKPQTNPSLRAIAERKMSLEGFLDHLAGLGGANPQTRYMSGFMSMTDPLQAQPALTDRALEAARSNLYTNFAAVGVVEFFDASILLMRHVLDWRNVYYARRNITAQRPRSLQLTEAQRNRILDFHALDVSLYATAKRELSRRLEELQPAFDHQLERYRLVNSVYAQTDAWYRRARKVARDLRSLLPRVRHR